MEEHSREIHFGDPAFLPRIVCPQIWTVQVDPDVNPSTILANTPPHAIYVTAKLHTGLYSVVTNTDGSVGESVEFKGIAKGRIVSVQDTIDSPTRDQVVDEMLYGIQHYRRCRLGPFPRDWFIPDSVKNARAKLPLYPQSMWMKLLKHYGKVESAWLVQEGPSKLFLVALWEQAESVTQILRDGFGRYIRIPKYSTARPLDVTIVEDDDKPLQGRIPDVDIPPMIKGVSTKGMTILQFQAFEALAQRVELLEKENAEMKQLVLELQKAEMMGRIDSSSLLSSRVRSSASTADLDGQPIEPPWKREDPPWKTQACPSQRDIMRRAAIPKRGMEVNPSLADLPPAGGTQVGKAAAAAQARAVKREAEAAPWKKMKYGDSQRDKDTHDGKDFKEQKINDYHNLLLGLAATEH